MSRIDLSDGLAVRDPENDLKHKLQWLIKEYWSDLEPSDRNMSGVVRFLVNRECDELGYDIEQAEIQSN